MAAGVEVIEESSYYETAPWGITEQPYFINSVAEVYYEGSPEELLQILQSVEKMMGRGEEQSREKWGPRIIDLDIIEFNGQVIESDSLSLPHPLYQKRLFVLIPLAELYPDYSPTGTDLTVPQLIESLPPEDIKRVNTDENLA